MPFVVDTYRDAQISELNDLIKVCIESDAAISEKYPDILARVRHLNHFSRDLPGLVRHVKGIADRNAVADWSAARGTRTMAELPWCKVSVACDEILAEPPLYERDWSTGPIDRLYDGALDTWMNIATVVSDFYFDNEETVDGAKLIFGATVIFRCGAEAIFERAEWPPESRLVDMTNALMAREDFDLDMLPRSLTYFGDVGLTAISAMANDDEMRQALEQSAQTGHFAFDDPRLV